MKKIQFLLLLLFSAVMIISCGRSELVLSEYKKWLTENSDLLQNTHSVDDVDYTLKYLSPYLAVRNNRIGDNPVFLLTFKHNKGGAIYSYGLKDRDVKYRREYFSFKSKDDLFFVDGSDTIRPLDVNYEDTYGLNNAVNLNLIFPADLRDADELRFVCRDREYSQEEIEVRLNDDMFVKVPKLIAK